MAFLNYFFAPLILILGLLILGKSAHFVVSAVTRMGHALKISQFITGFIILGVATSTPEIFVGLQSALQGTPQLSLGNLFGANIVLLTLIAGTAAVINRGITIRQELSHPGRIVQIGMLILAPLILLVDSRLSRLDALFLALLYLGYLIYVYRLRPKDSPPLSSELFNHKVLHTAFLAAAGFVGLIVASKAVVYSSLQIAALVHIPPVVVGTLLLSIGTNLPEISVVLSAVRHHHTNLVIGDVLGSASTNTLVIALVAGLHPFAIGEWAVFQTTAIFMVASAVAFFIFTRSGKNLSRREGLVLLALYVGFVTAEIVSTYFTP